MQQVSIPTNKGIKIVMTENIIRVEANSNYCKIYFNNEHPLTVAKLLQWFEDKLEGNFFCRIHRTHLINRQYITGLTLENKVTLLNGEQFQVSKRRKSAFRKMVA